MAVFAPTASPANSVTVTVPAGVKVSKDDTVLWSGGAQTVTVASGASVYVFATKAGTHDIVFTSGTLSVTMKLKASTTAAAAYNIAVSPTSQQLAAGAIGSATLKVTDVFGNPVPSTNKDDTGGVTVTATGEILLAGYNSTVNLGTDTAGEARIVIIAGSNPGTGALALAPAAKTNAWAVVYVPPTGAPAPVTSAAATIEVTGGSTSKTISITDSGRRTVSGKPGVFANGTTTGFAEGDTLKVWVKFPGQTSYTEGSAKRALDSGGAFEWSRKTGKKTYVYFSNNDGLVKSSSVIIPAK